MAPRHPRRFLRWALPVTLAGIAGVALAVRAADARFQAERDRAEAALARGEVGRAREALEALAARRPADGRVWLLLGRCEEAARRPARALTAWERVPPSAPEHPAAIESRGHLLISRGRFAEAENLLFQAAATIPRPGRPPVLRTLARLLRLEGRFDEVSLALTAAWAESPDPSPLLQELWQNDNEPVPVDGWKLFLDAAPPDDDRVRLGKARLALATNRPEDARAHLDRCLARRPEDPALWRARLDLALALDDNPGAREAAAHLPADALPLDRVTELVARLARQAGDTTRELQELSRLVRPHHVNAPALERLAVLAAETGNPNEASRLRWLKAQADSNRDWVRKLVIRKEKFRDHAITLVGLSAALGRPFDQRAWELVAGGMRADPPSRDFCEKAAEAALARLLAVNDPNRRPLLADLLHDLPPAPAKIAGPAPALPHPTFTDDAATAGLHFTFESPRSPAWLLPEILAGGVGLIDADGDGHLDVFCIQGGQAPPDATPPTTTGDRLFRNEGNGTFRDVTTASGLDARLAPHDPGMGVTVGDYDNDGRADLFLTRLRSYKLWHNRGDGTFEDATAPAGLAGPRENPTSAAFADLDNDGDLDLYVCHYALLTSAPPSCKNDKGEPYYCDPARYPAARDHVFRNDGGKFTDVTTEAGFTDPDGRGLGVVAADLDDDGKIDLYVANDGTANFLFHNLGGFRFEETGLASGAAASAEGGYRAGMGLAAADLDADGKTDLLVTNLYGEGSTFHHNLGLGMFADHTAPSGLLNATRYLTGFGVAALDTTNRGRLDLAAANGHVNDFRPYYPFAMPARLFAGLPGGKFADVSDRSGEPWSLPRLGRGLAAGDLDNDGRPDLILIAQDGPLAYFHNQTKEPGHALTLRLEGTPSNRDGIGARITVTTPAGRQIAQRLGGGSYLSAHDARLHFGLGTASKAEEVEVRWPSGQVNRWKGLKANEGHLLREGAPKATPLPGFPAPRPASNKPD